jgi:hypothetical protein
MLEGEGAVRAVEEAEQQQQGESVAVAGADSGNLV